MLGLAKHPNLKSTPTMLLRSALLVVAILFALPGCTRPIDVTSLPNLVSGDYKVAPYLDTAARLQEMGRESACEALTRASQSQLDDFQVIVLCRMLFTPRDGAEFRRPSIGNPSLLGKSSSNAWPLEPIALIDGVPFLITQGYLLNGFPEPSSKYLRYCMSSCEWNPHSFHVPPAATLREALDKLLASPAWKRPLTKQERSFFEAQIQ
jgi:hypothetical protein